MTEAISRPTIQDQSAEIKRVFEAQQKHQYVVARKSATERIATLRRFNDVLMKYEQQIEEACWKDLRKNKAEVAISEMGFVCVEIRHTIRHLQSWMTPKNVSTPITLFGSSSAIHYEPKGVCLIISPWNFPFNLSFSPLISAIAAGNTVVLKPSEMTPNCAEVMAKIVSECFHPEEVALFQGDAAVAQTLTALPFNHIFFTGSPQLGKIVMRAAAEHLTSVTLELGGKCPVIVDENADLDSAAAKVAWAKCFNMGQMCISPDYVLVHESKAEDLKSKIARKIKEYYGESPEKREQCPDLGRIVNERHYDRVVGLLEESIQLGARLEQGGQHNRGGKFIDPAILTNIPESAKIWEEEIFGPLLPIRSFKQLDEAIAYVNSKPKPLALYIFSQSNKNIKHILAETRGGGVTINDAGPHFYNSNLPFGGSNNSGIGKTHGESGFKDFSNERGVLRQTRFLPTSSFMLPPYNNKIMDVLARALVKYF